MTSKRRNTFYQNKKRETTEIGTCNLPSFYEHSERFKDFILSVIRPNIASYVRYLGLCIDKRRNPHTHLPKQKSHGYTATPPPTTAEPTYRPQPSQRGLGNRNFRGQQVIRQQETTVQPSTQAYQQPARRDYFTARPTSTAAPPRPQYETQPTQRPDFYRTNHLPQTTRSQETFPPVETTPRPSWQTNNQRGSANYNNNNNQQTTQPQQFYNQQTSQKQAFYQGTTYRPNYFETTQRQQPTTQKPSFYNNFNIPAATTTLRPYYPSEFSTQTSATRRQQQAYQTQPTTPQAPTTLHYQQDTNSNYETQKLYRSVDWSITQPE
ncbi:hypothetical protein AAG570_005023 [Ranatra chinensis]|uniref:Uncharacterized protein n=1 Tax=Ranatra chinensis TaxID=642074 RepID=A0ABD0XZA0_9HEMI